MRVRVLVGHGLGGGKFVEEGDYLELSELEARRQIAKQYVEAAPELVTEPPAEQEPAAEAEQESEEKPSNRGRRRER